jgi:hypothetical protein
VLEAEIRKIVVPGQLGQKTQTKPNQKTNKKIEVFLRAHLKRKKS